MNLWPPFLFSGIKVEALSDDFSYARVRLKLRWYNRNYVGVHYGGSLFSMTDPFYMLLLLHRLGSGWIVWDMKASIRYRRPGRSDVWAEFRVDDATLESIRREATSHGRYNPQFEIAIRDAEGEVIAEVCRTLYVKRKDEPRAAAD